MSVLSAHFQLFDRNRKLGWLTIILAVLFILPPVVITSLSGGNLWWFTMAAVILLPSILAGFIAETQKNILCTGSCFLLPGMTRNLIKAQQIIMALIGITVFLVAFFDRGLADLTAGNILPALALSFLALSAYAVVLLADFFIPFTSSLAAILILPYFMFIKLGKEANIDVYQDFFAHAGWIILIGAAILLATFRILTASHLDRRLAEQPYLSLPDLYRPSKARQFRNRRAALKNSTSLSQRPFLGVMNRCLSRASKARAQGKTSMAILWEALYLGLATSVPRQRWRIGLLCLVLVLFVVFCGYFDSRSAMNPESGMISWFSAFPFAFALIPVVWCQFLGTTNPGLICGRRETIQAGYHFMAWITLAVAAISGLVLALSYLLAPLLPAWETTRRVWSFFPPQNPHIPLLPLLVLPVMVAVYLLWRKSGAQFILSVAGVEIIIVFHAALNMGGYGWPLVGVLLISGGAWVALPSLWRRRVRGDL